VWSSGHGVTQANSERLVQNESLLDRIAESGTDIIPSYIRQKMYEPIYVPLVDQVYSRDLT
jgi:hypothetical protein